jgi:hypothetical protein
MSDSAENKRLKIKIESCRRPEKDEREPAQFRQHKKQVNKNLGEQSTVDYGLPANTCARLF